MFKAFGKTFCTKRIGRFIGNNDKDFFHRYLLKMPLYKKAAHKIQSKNYSAFSSVDSAAAASAAAFAAASSSAFLANAFLDNFSTVDFL